MDGWAAYRTHDSCNGCPWAFIGVALTQEGAKGLAERDAAPQRFGLPKIGRLPVLRWATDTEEIVTEDGAALIAPHDGEHYIVREVEIHG